MTQVVTIGLDIAKSVFQLHGVDAAGAVLFRKRLPRSRMLAFFEKLAPCLIGIEACGSAHYWGRELSRLGHDVRLIPPSYVKPYVKRKKNDAADAEAICEAVARPSMRFVPIKAPEQQSLIAHTIRAFLFASATAATFGVRRASNCISHGLRAAIALRMTDHSNGAHDQQLSQVAIALLG